MPDLTLTFEPRRNRNTKSPALTQVMIFIKTAGTMCFTKRSRGVTTQRTTRKVQTIITAEPSIAQRSRGRRPGGSSGDGLRLSGQPLQRLLPALPLQLCSDHLAALPVVLVHPVALQKQVEVNAISWRYV